jgi:hypothetical protein
MGIVGAGMFHQNKRRENRALCLLYFSGTNNARLAAMLRQLAVYHGKDMNNLFMVRIAQGLTHLGKGTMTLNPYHSDRMLLCRVALAGLLTVLVSFFDVKQSKNNFPSVFFFKFPFVL